MVDTTLTPERTRELMYALLRTLHGLTYVEAIAVLGCTIASIWARHAIPEDGFIMESFLRELRRDTLGDSDNVSPRPTVN